MERTRNIVEVFVTFEVLCSDCASEDSNSVQVMLAKMKTLYL